MRAQLQIPTSSGRADSKIVRIQLLLRASQLDSIECAAVQLLWEMGVELRPRLERKAATQKPHYNK